MVRQSEGAGRGVNRRFGEMGFYDDESQYTTSKNSRVLCGFVESTGGRKAVAVRFVASTKIVLGAELLKDFFEVVAINLYGDVLFC